MIIESSAPPRVDLAGGTIDIWPLYLFHPGATTVNFALSLHARCRIETRDDGRIVLESRDRQIRLETTVDRIGLEHHELSGLAKDIGSAAVLSSFVLLGLTWLLVLFF